MRAPGGTRFALLTCSLLLVFFFSLSCFFKYFDYGYGWLRFVVLAALVGAVYQLDRRGALRGRLRALAQERAPWPTLIGLVILLSVGNGTLRGTRAVGQGKPLSDQSIETVNAVRTVLRGDNPWASQLDRNMAAIQAARGEHDPAWLGYKYGPATLLVFAPLTRSFGEVGMVWTNALAMLVVAGALILLIRQAGSNWPWSVALAAGTFGAGYMASVIRFGETDSIAVALALLSLCAAEAKYFAVSGAFLAASISAKVLPGGIYAVVLWRLLKQPRFSLSLVLGSLAISGPAFVANPAAFVRNLILFPFIHQPDSTSLQFVLPGALRVLLLVVALGILLACAVSKDDSRIGVSRRLVTAHLSVLCSASFIHNNYLVWVYPLLALFIARHLLADVPGRPA